MDKTITTDLFALYDKWIKIVESQLDLLRAERIDESFEQLKLLEVEKRDTKLKIMDHSVIYDRLDLTTRERLTVAIQLLLALNEQAEPYLKAWYKEAGKDMKQVSTQQRILTSYGGTQSSDIISVYVDSKK